LDYRVSLIGLFIGFLVGLTGMGGGALLAPIMILVLKVPPVWAVGTDNAYSAVTKALGSIVHFRQKSVNIKIALWLACGSWAELDLDREYTPLLVVWPKVL